jgi:hypothetical protein
VHVPEIVRHATCLIRTLYKNVRIRQVACRTISGTCTKFSIRLNHLCENIWKNHLNCYKIKMQTRLKITPLQLHCGEYNYWSSNTNPTKNRDWTQVLRKGKQFLFFTRQLLLFLLRLELEISGLTKCIQWQCVARFGLQNRENILFLLVYIHVAL